MSGLELFNIVCILLGERGGGKTLYAIGAKWCSKEKDQDLPVPGFIDIYLQKKMKVLFIMTLDHPSYHKIPMIPIEHVFTQLHKWKDPSVYRIVCPQYQVQELLTLINSLNNLWNTAIFLEDTRKITGETVSKPLETLIIDSKNKNIDIYMMFHSWMQIPKEMYSMIDYIECFKVNQHPSCRQKEMLDYYDHALQVYTEVKANDFPFYHLTIDTGNSG